jgi:hypothetical protein
MTTFDGGSVATLRKGILLGGVRSSGEVLNSLGAKKFAETIVDKLSAIVGDHGDEFVSGGGFYLGKEFGKESKSVGFVLHREDESVFGIAVNNFEEVLVATPRIWSNGSTEIHVDAFKGFGDTRK